MANDSLYLMKKILLLLTVLAFSEAPMQYKEINGKRCAYQDVGKGYPLLLGHSYMWDSHMWKPQIEHLSKNFRVIAIDFWAHGESDSAPTEYSLKECADDYATLMQDLGCEKYCVIGLSVGGMWGTYMALNHPEHVDGLVLMDTFVGTEGEASLTEYLGLIDALAKGGFTSDFIDSVLPFFFSPHTFTHNNALATHFKEDLLKIKKENLPGICALGREIFTREDLLPRLGDITVPTMVIVGKDDIARPPHESEEMARLLPSSSLKVVENAGHIASLEQPGVVNTLLEQFLEKNILDGQNGCAWKKSKLQDPSRA
jgi:pimeloyl-ACP methyl ester carboxylesterase